MHSKSLECIISFANENVFVWKKKKHKKKKKVKIWWDNHTHKPNARKKNTKIWWSMIYLIRSCELPSNISHIFYYFYFGESSSICSDNWIQNINVDRHVQGTHRFSVLCSIFQSNYTLRLSIYASVSIEFFPSFLLVPLSTVSLKKHSTTTREYRPRNWIKKAILPLLCDVSFVIAVSRNWKFSFWREK